MPEAVSAPSEFETLCGYLEAQFELAKKIVYEVDRPTICQRLNIGGRELFAKREDTSRIHSYKWRGSYFKMHQAMQKGRCEKFVAASAGNHAQGVAVAANRLKVATVIFMPTNTPELKQTAVRQLGGEFVDVRLVGDCYDDASNASEEFAHTTSSTLIKPFDDPAVIAGQATVGLEMLQQSPHLTRIYVPIGGGGLASGMALFLKKISKSDCQLVGVEVENQNSMQLSIRCDRRIQLESVNTFCDGTAVAKPGGHTFEICRQLLDDVVCVSNEQVCSAMQMAWESGRFVPEPSGAIALAAALEYFMEDANEKVGVVITGGNMDFRTFPRVVSQSRQDQNMPGIKCRRYFRFSIAERNGELIRLLDQLKSDFNIVDFQYGKTDLEEAQPVLGIEGPADRIDAVKFAWRDEKILATEISGGSLPEFRVIPFRPDLCKSAIFLRVDFPDRPGALRELMHQISSGINICYFNYIESGELEGHALIGFELLHPESRDLLFHSLFELGLTYKAAGNQ